MRVGALDGRHPDAGKLALEKIRAALKPAGRLFIDGGDPLQEIMLCDGETGAFGKNSLSPRPEGRA